MTAIWNDIHEQERNNRNITELIYADDTILFNKDLKKINGTLGRLEKLSRKYGMKLNKKNANT